MSTQVRLTTILADITDTHQCIDHLRGLSLAFAESCSRADHIPPELLELYKALTDGIVGARLALCRAKPGLGTQKDRTDTSNGHQPYQAAAFVQCLSWQTRPVVLYRYGGPNLKRVFTHHADAASRRKRPLRVFIHDGCFLRQSSRPKPADRTSRVGKYRKTHKRELKTRFEALWRNCRVLAERVQYLQMLQREMNECVWGRHAAAK